MPFRTGFCLLAFGTQNNSKYLLAVVPCGAMVSCYRAHTLYLQYSSTSVAVADRTNRTPWPNTTALFFSKNKKVLFCADVLISWDLRSACSTYLLPGTTVRQHILFMATSELAVHVVDWHPWLRRQYHMHP